MIPGLQERLMESSEEETRMIADLVRCLYLSTLWSFLVNPMHVYIIQIQKGASSARSDDTRSLKTAVIDWITPRGQALNPPLARNVKADRGFHHECTGALLCPAGLDWSNAECGDFIQMFIMMPQLVFGRTRDQLRDGELVITGDQWPVFLFSEYKYDPENPWNGLFRSSLLVTVHPP
jgi:hypothetical protein